MYSLFLANLKDKLSEQNALFQTLFTMRNMESRVLKVTPFEAHFGRKQPNRINNKLFKPTLKLLDWSKVKTNLLLLEEEREALEKLQETRSHSGTESD